MTERADSRGFYFKRVPVDPAAPDYVRPPLCRAYVSPLGARFVTAMAVFIPLLVVVSLAGLDGFVFVASYGPAMIAQGIYEYRWRQTHPPSDDRVSRRFVRTDRYGR